MKPVMMTSFGWPDGNCFAACMASILELPLEALPSGAVPAKDPNEDPAKWTEPWNAWLRDRGFALHWISAWLEEVEGKQEMYLTPGYSILICDVLPSKIMADGSPLRHATVSLDGRIVHNPQPDCTDNAGLWPHSYAVFQSLDPARTGNVG